MRRRAVLSNGVHIAERLRKHRHDLILLFFSRSRRHTRLQGDWSSDVCSSDLSSPSPDTGEPSRGAGTDVSPALAEERSEERRAGEGWRYRVSPDHSKKTVR